MTRGCFGKKGMARHAPTPRKRIMFSSRLRTPFILIMVLMGLVGMAGCRQATPTPSAPADVKLTMRVDPDPPAVGEGTLVITLANADGTPIDGAKVSALGEMDHAGMAPVEDSAKTGQNGEYRVPFSWTMGGGWVVTITAELPNNGGTVTEKFDVFVSAVSSGSIINQGKDSADTNGMDGMNMGEAEATPSN